jgi:hypothetical protein
MAMIEPYFIRSAMSFPQASGKTPTLISRAFCAFRWFKPCGIYGKSALLTDRRKDVTIN